NIPSALQEANRVLKRGGRFFCMEFSSSDWPGFGKLYEAWASNVIPRIGKAVADDEDSYRYLAESIRTFPNQEKLAAMMRQAGLARVAVRNLSGGIAAIHSGWRL
ncbi:MAG TPA: class I SAM-dependent methyltransferase, partial [Rhodopila sp.]